MGTPQTGEIAVDIAARESHVVGKEPRIAAIPNDEIDEDARALVRNIRASVGAGDIPIMPEYMRTMLKHRELFQRQMELGTALFLGKIPPRDRELAVLRCGWLCQAPYEWGEHVNIAKRYGVSDEEVARMVKGSDAPGWSEHDAAVIRGVEELIGNQALSDATWNVLAHSWSEEQLIEYLVMVGQYVATALLQNSLRIRLQDGNIGLAAR